MLVEQDLAPWAVEYVRQRLLHGNTLAAAALDNLVLEEGKVTTCLPQGTVLKRLEDFRMGGKLPPPPPSEWRSTERGDETLLMIPIPNTDDWFVGKIREFLDKRRGRACIFEDALARVGDPVLQKVETKYATFGTEIYHLILDTDAEPGYIEKVLRRAKGIPTFIGVFTEWQGDKPNKNPIALSKENLQALAAKAHKLIVGAFDGESYVIWNRQVT
jgi:hypothetical protein